MKRLIKKTISVPLGSEEYIIAIMSAINFVEIERIPTGGYMSQERLQLTFEGSEADYSEDYYLKIINKQDNFFYSLRYPDGYCSTTVEQFKKAHDRKAPKPYEIHSFSK